MKSVSLQRSTHLPPAKRNIEIPLTRTGLPVAGMPLNSPVWMALNVKRQATRVPLLHHRLKPNAGIGEAGEERSVEQPCPGDSLWHAGRQEVQNHVFVVERQVGFQLSGVPVRQCGREG